MTLADEFFAWLAETWSEFPLEVFESEHDLAPGQSHLLVTVRLLERASQLREAGPA